MSDLGNDMVCDYEGKCNEPAYAEIYPSLMNEGEDNVGWNYLCKRHFEQEMKRLKGELYYCLV